MSVRERYAKARKLISFLALLCQNTINAASKCVLFIYIMFSFQIKAHNMKARNADF